MTKKIKEQKPKAKQLYFPCHYNYHLTNFVQDYQKGNKKDPKENKIKTKSEK